MALPDLLIHSNLMPQVSTDASGLSLRPDVLYTNAKGEEKGSLHKSADNLLGRLNEPLRRLLEPGEAVFYVCRAQAPLNSLEQLVGGWYVLYQTRVVLVFTSRRMLHLLVNNRGDWRRGLRDVRWGDVPNARVKGTLTRSLKLEYRNLSTETYTRLRYRDGAKLRVLLPPLLEASRSELSPMQGMVPHCPDCFAILTPRAYLCPHCGLVFRDEKTLLRRTLLIPGGGYFYTGQWGFGVLSALYETWFAFVLIVTILIALGVMPIPQEEGQKQTQADTLSGMVGVLWALGIEKLFHYYHSLRVVRDFSPTGRKQLRPEAPWAGGASSGSATPQGWTKPSA
ncbi:MAG: zinc ribbon domain-containing protein [Acidobacteriota bacterium]|nr:zinc ribbon domain-containing protein [Acidobacteriota bacterium]